MRKLSLAVCAAVVALAAPAFADEAKQDFKLLNKNRLRLEVDLSRTVSFRPMEPGQGRSVVDHRRHDRERSFHAGGQDLPLGFEGRLQRG